METRINACGKNYRELNSELREILAQGASKVYLEGVNGQYYMGAGLRGCHRLIIYGTAGNDTACYMDGPEMVIYGNAQDGLGNTMNKGRVIVHGSAGDIMGYGMRGGEIYVRDSVGYRVGIHMKEYQCQYPLIVIGKQAGAFLGEYMAGGRIVVMGLDAEPEKIVGHHCGTGMHGGCMYIRDTVPRSLFSSDVEIVPLNESDQTFLNGCIDAYCRYFNREHSQLTDLSFMKVVPCGKRPYGRLYVGV